MAGIIDGQSVNAANSNAAWLAKNGNDTTIGELGLNNSAASSGPAITNTQGAINNIIAGVGGNQYTAPTSYGPVPASTISGLTHEQALGVFARLFQAATGHKHTGVDGDGPNITAVLSLAPTGGTGITGDVRLIPGTKISLSQFGQGITINASPYSLADVLTVGNTATAGIDFSGGAIAGLSYADVLTSGIPPGTPASGHMYVAASGDNHFYGKNSSGVTRRIDSTIAASGNSAIYGDAVIAASGAVALGQSGQVITVYAPASGAAVNSIAASGSAALTGAVLIAASGAAQVTESGQVITVYAPASGAAVNSFAASGQSALTGAVTISASGATQLTQSGQNISIYTPASGSAVNSIAASGSSALTGAVVIAASGAAQVTESGQVITVYAPASGSAVNSFAASGQTALTGAVTISASGAATLTQSGQNISIYAPASGAAVNSLAASGAAALTGAVTIAASGAAQVSEVGNTIYVYAPAQAASGAAVNSLAASGQTPLTGAVTLSAGNKVSLTQSGQNIAIAANPYALVDVLAVGNSATAGIDFSGGAISGLAYADLLTSGIPAGTPAANHIYVAASGDNNFYYKTSASATRRLNSTIAASGQSALYGDVIIAPSGSVQLGQSGQTITVYAPASGSAVNSLAASGSSGLTGAVVIAASGGAQVTQSGQTITVYAPTGGAGGGVTSIAASGQSGITGAATLSASGGIVLTQSGQNIQIYAPTGGSGGTGTAITKTITQASHGFAAGKWLYLNGSTYALASASADAPSEVIGVVAASGGVNTFDLTTEGYISGLSGLTAGQTYYLSATAAGGIDAAEPTTVGYVSKPVLVADSTTSGWVIRNRGIVINSPAASQLGMVAACQLVPNTFWSTSVGTSYTNIGTVGSITFTSTSGISTASAPGTNVPGFKVASLAPGTYKITAIGSFGSSGSAGYSFTVYDGTTYGQSNVTYITGGSNCTPQIITYFTYATTQTNIQYQLAARTQSGTITATVSNQQSNSMDLNFIIERIY